MAEQRPGILQIYREIIHEPLTVYQRIGHRDTFKLNRFFFAHVANVTAPDTVRHVLVTNAKNYRKTPIGRALLEPILGRGLLTSEGSFWRRQRRIAAPAFHHKRIATFADMMVELTLEMLDEWQGRPATAGPLDIQSEMSRVTMKIITRTMFSDHLDDDEARLVSDAIKDLNRHRLRLRDFIGLPEWLPRFPDRHVRAAVRTIDRTVNRLIAERRADGTDHGDLLSMLMLAEDEETGERMSDRQLRDEVITMFVAGHETTATALTWTFYALDRHRDVADRLFAELDSVLSGAAPTLADLDRLPYTRMVIEETMRLYPTVAQIARQAVDDDEIDGVHVPKGSIINMNIWLTHRDPSIWADPETFDPERFDPKRAQNRPKHAYYPFGGGPRICIGNNFSLMEAQLILATVARAWRLRLVDGYTVHPIGNIVLRPRGGLPMHVEARGPVSG